MKQNLSYLDFSSLSDKDKLENLKDYWNFHSAHPCLIGQVTGIEAISHTPPLRLRLIVCPRNLDFTALPHPFYSQYLEEITSVISVKKIEELGLQDGDWLFFEIELRKDRRQQHCPIQIKNETIRKFVRYAELLGAAATDIYDELKTKIEEIQSHALISLPEDVFAVLHKELAEKFHEVKHLDETKKN